MYKQNNFLKYFLLTTMALFVTHKQGVWGTVAYSILEVRAIEETFLTGDKCAYMLVYEQCLDYLTERRWCGVSFLPRKRYKIKA